MIGQIKIDSKLWTKFTEEAKRSKRDPARVLSELLREYIDQRERQRLNQQTIKAAKRSGVSEDENIEDLIKGLRK